MFDILMYLFESYFDAGSYPDADKLSRKLSAAGFEDDEISDALNWLSALHQSGADSYPVDLAHDGFRYFAPLEAHYLSDEARNFLVYSIHQHIISPMERELIIDRALALKQASLGIDKVKIIMLIVLWDRHSDLDPLLVESLLNPVITTQLH